MDSGLVYAKTPIGDEAVRQSTRVVQRNLRLVLVQIDGKTTVGELGNKIGNQRLVESAIKELEEGGFIVPSAQAAAVWEMDRHVAAHREQVSAISQFSSFGASSVLPDTSLVPHSRSSQFSSFGKPILPAERQPAVLEAPSAEEAPPAFRQQRAGISGSMLLKLALVLVLAVALGLVFFPYDGQKERLAASMTRLLGTPVKVDAFALRLLPKPHWEAAGVRIGDSITVGRLGLASPLSIAFGGVNGVEALTLGDVVATPAQLLSLPLLQGNLPLPALKQIFIENLAVRTDSGLPLGAFNGQLNLAGGVLRDGQLENPDRSLQLRLSANGGALDIALEGRGWKPFPSSLLSLDGLQAKATLHADRVDVENIDTIFLGGIMKGRGSLSWASAGLQLDGTANLARFSLRQVAAAFVPKLSAEGEVNGALRLTARGTDWDALWSAIAVTADVEVLRGTMSGVDLGEAARRGAGAAVRAGSTRFDRLTARLDINANRTQFSNLMLDAGLVSASGQGRGAAGGEIDANLVSTVRTSVSTLRTPLKVEGKLPVLTVTAGR